MTPTLDLSMFQACTSALVNLGFAWMVGVLAARHWLDSAQTKTGRRLEAALTQSMTAAIVVCFIAMALSLWQAAAAMADVRLMAAGPTLLLAFAATEYGNSGVAALGLLLVLALWHGVLHCRRRSGVYSAIAALLLLLIAAARVRLGHAFEHGALSLAAAVELTHLLAMALWVGSVFVAAWVTLPRARSGESNWPDSRYLHALSQWATVALAGVLASGAYNAYRVLNAPAELLQTQYGWVLTAKLCFVALAVALGGWNRFVGFPAALANQPSDGDRAGITPVLTVLRVESIALLLVLLAAAVLTGNAPPSTT